MTSLDIREQFTIATGLRITEVFSPGQSMSALRALQNSLLRHFPQHAHVLPELDAAWREGSHDPEVIVHAWLLENEVENACGFLIFHTNLRRAMMLQHFVAMDKAMRSGLPFNWMHSLFDAALAVSEREAAVAGVRLLGSMGENDAQHMAGWRRIGYRLLAVDYHEPEHGKHWADYEELTYLTPAPMVRLTEYGSAVPLRDVATAAVSAYLLDHYLLEPDNPTVTRTLELARGLPD